MRSSMKKRRIVEGNIYMALWLLMEDSPPGIKQFWNSFDAIRTQKQMAAFH